MNFLIVKHLKPIGVTPDIHAIHIPYPEFIDEQGRPIKIGQNYWHWELKKRSIVLISNRGLRSAGTFLCFQWVLKELLILMVDGWSLNLN